jgi:hypothetical protein
MFHDFGIREKQLLAGFTRYLAVGSLSMFLPIMENANSLKKT